MPTLAGFTAFVIAALALTTQYQADPGVQRTISTAFNIAVDIVNQTLMVVPDIYMLAVYALATSNVINYAIDPAGAPLQPPLQNNGQPGLPFFANLRALYGINSFSAGVVQTVSDQGTSTTLLVQEALKNITLSDLALLKDPWGRRYLALAQKYGPTLWGVT